MELEVFWTEQAERRLKSIYDYFLSEVNKPLALKIVEGIVEKTIQLTKNPFIGQKESLLSQRAQDFRYLIHGNYKIIYWVNEQKQRIEIATVFDTRQNPTKLVKEIN